MNIRDLIARVGGPTRVAQICGIRAPSVYSWRTVPQERCAAIEHATAGAVTCEEMRPDIRWHRVADPDWPHPDGRPLVDVTPRTVAVPVEQAA